MTSLYRLFVAFSSLLCILPAKGTSHLDGIRQIVRLINVMGPDKLLDLEYTYISERNSDLLGQKDFFRLFRGCEAHSNTGLLHYNRLGTPDGCVYLSDI